MQLEGFLHASKLEAWIKNFGVSICHVLAVFVVSLFGGKVLET